MKKFALIAFGMVALATVACIVLVRTEPVAVLRVRSIGPTGQFRIETNSEGEEVRSPFWQFAITNSGRTTAWWSIDLELEGAVTLGQLRCRTPDPAKMGILAPKQELIVTMPVPADTNRWWGASVTYSPEPGAMRKTLLTLTSLVPRASRLIPQPAAGHCSEDWHITTNIAPVVVSPQNGTNL